MIQDIPIYIAKRCTCDVCGYQWVSIAEKPPGWCQNRDCRSREWNGKKQWIKLHDKEIKLPAPRKVGRPKTITLLLDRDEQF